MKNLFFLFLISPIILPQPIENNFIDALINNKENIADFIDKDELAKSRRLGIEYDDVKHKYLISFDIPDDIKAAFREGNYNYTLQTLQLEDGFSVVTLAVGSINYLQKFYFLNYKFVPPSRYFTRNWQQKESKYFKFRISEPKYFNDYCIKRLDDFVDSLCSLLEVAPQGKELLEKEKLHYTFCRDENEVEKITGYKSKGMSVLAYDEVITAYQTHFHEAAHLLINFRLKKLGLHTLPFLMEGFAVALGGRGGMAPRVVTNLGYFLQKSGFLTYDSILTYGSFYSQDANMTYAVSGLYNRFLIDELGGRGYLELYKKVNGNLDFVKNIKHEGINFPSFEKFENYLSKYLNDSLLLISDRQHGNYYCFSNGSNTGLTPLSCNNNENIFDGKYTSKLYIDITNKDYNGEYYLIKKDLTSLKLYNCYNNEQVFSYEKSFSLNPIEINSSRYFCLKCGLFECEPVNY